MRTKRDVSPAEIFALEELSCADGHLVFDGHMVAGLQRRGLVNLHGDGWGLTDAGRCALLAFDESSTGVVRLVDVRAH